MTLQSLPTLPTAPAPPVPAGPDSRRQRRRERQRAVDHAMNSGPVNLVVVLLILVSVALLFVEHAHPHNFWVAFAGKTITGLFAIELLLRLYGEGDARRFFGRHWLDLLAVVPLTPFRVLRALRLLRVFQILPLLARSNRHLRGLLRQSTGFQLRVIAILLTLIMVVGMMMVHAERGHAAEDFRSLDGALWWSSLSLIAGEPVGPMPETAFGKMLLVLVMLGGITLFALFTGTVSALMVERLHNSAWSDLMDLEKLHDHILVCGWNRSAPVVLAEFAVSDETAESQIVVVAETQPPDFDAVLGRFPHVIFLQGDYTRVDVLRRARVETASRAILLADKSRPERTDQDRDARTVLAALMIEKLHRGIFACAELLLRDNVELLKTAGVEEVVVADDYSGFMLAASARMRGIVEIATEIFSNQTRNKIYKCNLPVQWVGETFVSVQSCVKLHYGGLLLAVERGPKGARRSETNPPADMLLEAGDRLVLIAEKRPPF